MKKLFRIQLILLLIIFNSCQSSFQGNEKIKITDNYNEISSLEELITLPEFKDKILLINLYSFHCKHSKDEFPYIKKLQKSIEKAPNAEDYIFVHLSTPKWAFEGNGRSSIEDYNLAGYHFLMNEKFQDEFWSNFPKEIRGTPFLVEVTKDKEIIKTNRPSSIFLGKALKNFHLNTLRFIKGNLDIISSKDPDIGELTVAVDYTKDSSNPGLSFFINSKEIQVHNRLNEYVKKSIDSIPDKDGLTYSFNVPLDSRKLDSVIKAGYR